MLHTRRNDEIIRLLLLHNQPHALHIVFRIAPITQGVHIAQLQMILHSLGNAARRQGNLARHEILTAALGFVIEQNTVDREHAIRVAVFLHHPEAVLLRHRVGAVRMERRSFALRNLLHLAVQFGGRSLIHLAAFCQPAHANRFQHAQNTQGIHVARILRRVEGYLHMTLRRQIVDFVGLDFAHQPNQAGRIRQVAVMQVNCLLLNQVVNARRVGDRGTADDAVHLIVFFKQKLRQIGTILTGNAGNQCLLRHRLEISSFHQLFLKIDTLLL